MNLRRISWIPYAVVIATSLVLWLGLDFNGLYGQDAHEYLRYSKALRTAMDTGESAGDFYWPKLFPFLGALVSYTGISANVSLLLISLGSILGSLFFAQRILQFLYKSSGTWILLLGAATQVYFIRSGFIVMSDALATFWIMGFLLNYVKFRESRAWKQFVWILIFSVLAVFTRYASIVLIAIPFVHSVWVLLQQWSIIVRIVLGTSILATGAGLLFVNNQLVSLIGEMFESWHVGHLFQRTFVYDAFPQSYWVPNGIYIWSNFAHFGFLSIGALLLLFWRRWNFQLTWIWIGVLAYLVFIGGIGFQNQRFMVISHLWVLTLLFPAFESLRNWLSQRKLWVVFVGGALLFNAAFFTYSFSKLYAMHRLEKEVAMAVNELEDGPKVYAFYITPSLDSYEVPNETVDLWEEEISFEKGGIVVFNEKQFGQNKRVMRQWNRLNREYDLEIIDELSENWTIYRIQ